MSIMKTKVIGSILFILLFTSNIYAQGKANSVELKKQAADSTTSVFDWAKTQTPYQTGGFEPAPLEMNTNFGKLEFPG